MSNTFLVEFNDNLGYCIPNLFFWGGGLANMGTQLK